MTLITLLLVALAAWTGPLAPPGSGVPPSATPVLHLMPDTLDPSGLWLTEDSSAVIRIEDCGEELCGFIHWLPAQAPEFDRQNPDEDLQDRPLCGLPLLWGFTRNPDRSLEWKDGQLYAADEGNTYSGRIRLEDPDRLELRGYRGIPLFGRSQTWTRASPEAYPPCDPPGSVGVIGNAPQPLVQSPSDGLSAGPVEVAGPLAPLQQIHDLVVKIAILPFKLSQVPGPPPGLQCKGPREGPVHFALSWHERRLQLGTGGSGGAE